MPISNIFAVKTEGESMYPSILEGSTLLVATTAPSSDIKEGDVVIYRKNGKNIAHRAIEISEAGIKTRGDNHTNPDPYILSHSEIIGKAIYVISPEGVISGIPGQPSSSYWKVISIKIIRFIYKLNKYRLYNLIVGCFMPFITISRSHRPTLNFKKNVFLNNHGGYDLPEYSINFHIFSIPVASVLKFESRPKIVYIRSLFENNTRIRNLVESHPKTQQCTSMEPH